MARKYRMSLCLGGLMVLPASLALACHLEKLSMDVSCTQYKIQVAGVGVPQGYSIKYTFVAAPNAGGLPFTISKTVPVSATTSDFTESVTGLLKLVGGYDAKSISGSAVLITASGATEGTPEIALSPVALNCAPLPPGS
jgi:hypothetical protein